MPPIFLGGTMDQNQPTQPTTTEPKVEQAPVKMAKLRVLRDVIIAGQIRKPGDVVECTEEEAQAVLGLKHKAYHPCYGYLPEIGPLMEGGANPLARKELVRAERVA